jgi:hypothetical protein
VQASVSVTTSITMIEPSAPGRAFVNHAFGVVSTRSKRFVFAVLARAFAGEDFGAPSLRLILRNILPTRTLIITARTAMTTTTIITTATTTIITTATTTIITTVTTTIIVTVTTTVLVTITTIVKLARPASLAAPVALAEATTTPARFRPPATRTILALATFVVVRVVG